MMAFPTVTDLPSIPECTACGACCFSRLATYVRVTGDDHLRLGERAEDLVWFEANRAYMRMLDGHCAALVVSKDTGELLCSVYETRPQTCRDLLRGSGACLGEIHTKGDRPLIALGRTR
ncbi:YkgJ family cysteine cluster protein [Pendulispora rubella]|uniref:YkgJ family cysteine cluster protein n=1 Tax=Pendulispora rubella TaxID=2741070 RepID=UPI0030E0CFE4